LNLECLKYVTLSMSLIIEFPGSGTNCDDNDGFTTEIFIVTEKRWKEIEKSLETLKAKSVNGYTEFDYTSGGHGCIITIDFFEAFKECRILEKKAHPAVVKFAKKIQSTRFLGELTRWIARKSHVDE